MTDLPDTPASPPTGGAGLPIPADPDRDPLRTVVAVMDRLRSPGGCPWDAEQTHESLLPYAVEEAHELAEAVDAGDRDGLREELGDLLLQVVFHARIAQEDPADPFDIDDVARTLTAKLVRRHPHVFADARADTADVADTADAVFHQWEQIKRQEKPDRGSSFDGIPAALGALARAQKVAAKADRTGLTAEPPPAEDLGGRLLALVVAAQADGQDAETALRRATAVWEERLRAAETAARVGPAPR